jgi:6-phosphogluconolactonase
MKPWISAASFVFLPTLALSVGCSAASSSTPSDPVDSTSAALSASDAQGAVFTLSNAANANALVAFDRAADGSLTPAGSIATGGAGSGAGLGSQGAIVRDGAWLFAVNAGSNDVSVFSLEQGRPTLASRHASGGTGPISVTAQDGLVYVLNATAPANVTGFWVDDRGDLHPLEGSTQALSAPDVGPAEVAFAPSGGALVVTEKATNDIDVLPIDGRGRAQAAVVSASSGATPFGFGFTPWGALVVSEAVGGAAGASTVSSYDLSRHGAARVVSASVPDAQTAACWIAVGDDGRVAFTTNAGSANISAYRIGDGGKLTLDGVAASMVEGAHPIDMAFTPRGRFLYALESGVGTIGAYAADGAKLTAAGSATGLPASASGLVAW